MRKNALIKNKKDILKLCQNQQRLMTDIVIMDYKKAKFKNNIYKLSNSLCLVSISDAGMVPTFKPGEIALVNCNHQKIIDDVIYAINYFGDVIVKKAYKRDKDYIFIGDNEDMERFKWRKFTNGVVIIGRVIKNMSPRDIA